jgi:hypothetical protein
MIERRRRKDNKHNELDIERTYFILMIKYYKEIHENP